MPVVRESIHACRARRAEERIESIELGIVVIGKAIDRQRAPSGVENAEEAERDSPVICVYNDCFSGDCVCSFVEISRDPLDLQRDAILDT